MNIITKIKIRGSVAVVGAALCLHAETTSAQVDEPLLEGSINVQRFNPAPGPNNFITTRGARTSGDNAFSVGVLGSFGKDPFIVGVAGQDDTRVVQGIVTGDVLVSYTPTPILQLGLRLPVTYVKGNGINPEDGTPGTFTGDAIDAIGLSDPELEGKFRLVGEADSAFVLGAAVFLGAPLGNATADGAYIGTESVSAGVRAIADLRAGPASFGANIGFRYKDEGRIGGAEFGPDAIYGLAAGIAVAPVIHVVADIFGSSQFSSDVSTNAAEVNGALKVLPHESGWTFLAGGGTGLAQGSVGVPAYRVFVGLGFANEGGDADSDGIADTDDQCPTEAEDTDGFEDEDGCPDMDNDGDAIEDSVDKCPDEAEDLDKFEDSDGCPDKDNDKDGIPDVGDRCPDEAETVNGFEDEDGCPDVPDRDADGVADDVDECPDEPEDTDGFQDLDGCPDPDNDGDGIPDDRDECVDTAEDMNGKDDEDGCPED